MPHESHNTILCVLTSMVHVALRQITGAYAGFLRGGPNFKISRILDIHAASSEAASLC